MRDDAVLRRALPLGRGLGPIGTGSPKVQFFQLVGAITPSFNKIG